MGVELGKVLAKAIHAQLDTPEEVKGHDSSVRRRTSSSLADTDLVCADYGSHPLLSEVQEGVKYNREVGKLEG